MKLFQKRNVKIYLDFFLNVNMIRENKFIKNKNIGGFLLVNNKTPDINKIYKEEDSQDLLTLQIKYALKKMEKEYFFRNKIENKLYKKIIFLLFLNKFFFLFYPRSI